jgi:hypothetical protein
VMASSGSHPIPTIVFEQFHKVANLHRNNISLVARNGQLPRPT